jgi:hypothetical protein
MPREYDARFTEFAYSIRDENWDYLFDDDWGIFSYNKKLHFSFFVEYLKEYNKQQIFTKLSQLGATNQNIVNFKKEFKDRLFEFLNDGNENVDGDTSIFNFKVVIKKIILKIKKFISPSPKDLKFSILFDLFIDGEPMNKFCKIFGIDPYYFLNDYLKDKFLEVYRLLTNLDDVTKNTLPTKINPNYLKGKLRKDKYWKDII